MLVIRAGQGWGGREGEIWRVVFVVLEELPQHAYNMKQNFLWKFLVSMAKSLDR